jgi:PAS domain S-box-containing protein
VVEGDNQRPLIESLPWPASWVAVDGMLRRRNAAGRRHLGEEPAVLWSRVEPPDRARVERAWKRAVAAGTTFRVEAYLRAPLDGRLARYRFEAMPPPRGGAARLLILVRRSAEPPANRELALQERFRHAIDAAGALIYESDLRTDAVLSWHGLARLLGYREDALTTRRDWLALVHPEDRARCVAETERASREADVLEIEYRARHRDGTFRTLHENTRILRDQTGLAARHVGVVMDVTERALAEETLRRADRHKNELLAMLGHELRNPLAALSSGVEALAESPERALKLVPLMRRQVQTLGRLVDDLANTARVVRGEIALRREPVMLEEVVQRALRTAEPALAGHGHVPRVRLLDGSLETYGDPTRLEQVVVNLLSNAAKYTPAGRGIELTLQRRKGRGEIVVRDEGQGIDADLLPAIFDLFTQGPAPADRSNAGLGIGLALGRRLVELHGGTLCAESRGRGHGSTFTVRLPLRRDDRPALSTPPPPPLERPAEPMRVLVVDDNEDAAEMLAHVLSRAGHEVRTAHDGDAGLERARELVPQVAVLDIGLPRRNGYELAMAMRGDPTLRDTRLIALTGYGTREDRRRAEEAGFDHHLVKPADPKRLRELMRPRGG